MVVEEKSLIKFEKEFESYLRNLASKEDLGWYHSGASYQQFFSHRMLIIVAIRKGIPNSLFLSFKESTPFTEVEWSEFLNVSVKSLQRYKKDKEYIFKSIQSEKIIELAEVTALGREVFDSSDQFYLWLNTPSFALSNMKPVELLKDSYGKEMVMNELNRIDQGIFA